MTTVAPFDFKNSVRTDWIPSESVVGSNAEDAMQGLQLISSALHKANQANVYCRWIMGKQLDVIQSEGLWRDIFITDSGPPPSFEQWVSKEFVALTKFSRETAYGAMKIARAKFLASKTAEEIMEFEQMTNVMTIAIMEQRNRPVTEDLIEKAKTMPVKEFSQIAGMPKGVRKITTTTESETNAASITYLLGVISRADPDGVDEMVGTFKEYMEVCCGNNPTDVMDGLNGLMTLAIQEPESIEQDRRDAIDDYVAYEDLTQGDA